MTVSTPAPVTLVKSIGPRTATDDFIREHGLDAPGSLNGSGPATAAPERVPFPEEKFDALCAAEPRFKRTLNHTRRDKVAKGWSLSEFDQSLANFAVSAGWSDPEIGALIRKHRAMHGGAADLAKGGRGDYLERTIFKARGGNAEQDAEQEPEQPRSPSDPPEYRNRRGEVYRLKSGRACTELEWVSEVTGVTIVKVGKIGGNGKWAGYLTVKHARGHTREMDPIPWDRLLEPTYMRKKLFQGTDLPIARLKGDEWDDVAAALAAAAVEREHGNDNRDTWIALLRDYSKEKLLTNEVEGVPVDLTRTDHKVEIIVRKRAEVFVDKDQRLWTRKEPFASWLRVIQRLYLDGDKIGTGLVEAGFEPKQLSVRVTDVTGDSKKVVSCRYYRSPRGFFDA